MGAFKSLLEPNALRIFLPVGLFVLAWCSWQWKSEESAIRRSEPVKAEVLSTGVQDYTTGSGKNRERHWRPVIRFTYEYQGVPHTSSTVTPLNQGGSRTWADEIVGRFHDGQTTTAFVDPSSPAEAFLIPARSWKPRAGAAVGALLAIASAVGLMLYRRAAKEES